MANNIITFPTNNIVIEDAIVTPINPTNGTNPIISETITQANSIFPTSSWEANNWNERTLPWEGIESGRDLSHVLNTDQVWNLSGLNYGFEVIPLFGVKETDENPLSTSIFGVFRDDNHVFLGSGTKRFVPIGNERTKELCNILHGMGFSYENAGCFDGGKVTYVSMKWRNANIAGEAMDYYVVVVNSFDGTKPFGVYITPIRIWCKNTLNLAIEKATRFWKLRHTVNAHIRLEEVESGLTLLGNYIGAFEREVDRMKLLTCDKDRVRSFIDMLFPITDNMQPRAVTIAENKRAELMYRYEYAPDVVDMEQSAFRFINAVSDYVDHTEPVRKTSTWKEKRFANNLGGNELLDTAYAMVNSL